MYEERVFAGILHYRHDEKSPWSQFTAKELTLKLFEARHQGYIEVTTEEEPEKYPLTCISIEDWLKPTPIDRTYQPGPSAIGTPYRSAVFPEYDSTPPAAPQNSPESPTYYRGPTADWVYGSPDQH